MSSLIHVVRVTHADFVVNDNGDYKQRMFFFLSPQDAWPAFRMTTASSFLFNIQIVVLSHIYPVSNFVPPVPRPRSPQLAWGLATLRPIHTPHAQTQSACGDVGTPQLRGGM